jgi:hypothetical protein
VTPLAPPPADWPVADWAPARPLAPAEAAPLTPVPPAAEGPTWGERGKTVSPAAVAVLSVVTVGAYLFFYWWRVSREADLLKGRRHAHGLARTGILMAALGGLCAILLVLVILVQAFILADSSPGVSGEDIAKTVVEGSLPLLALMAVAFFVYAAGSIVLYVAKFRSWDSIRAAERSAGRRDTVNPGLYLFLPIGLSVAGVLVNDVAAPFGSLLSVASFAAAVAFAAVTQAHLNHLWTLGVAGPAPAPVAR